MTTTNNDKLLITIGDRTELATVDEVRWQLAEMANDLSVLTTEERAHMNKRLGLIHGWNSSWKADTAMMKAPARFGFCTGLKQLDAMGNTVGQPITKVFMDKTLTETDTLFKSLWAGKGYVPCLTDIPIIGFVDTMKRGVNGTGSAEDALRLCLAMHAPEILRTSLSSICHVGTSPIHGKGVFASRDIKEGELVTLYPATIVGIQRVEGMQTLMNGRYDDKLNKYFSVICPALFIGFDAEVKIMPSLEDVEDPKPGLLGHMINSATTSRLVRKADYDPNINVELAPIMSGIVLGIVAIRPISKGSELLMHYGEHFEF